MNLSALEELTVLINGRKDADPSSSYVASLFAKGTKKIAQKVGEEGVETAIAAVDGDKNGLVSESADLLFHLMVLLSANDLSLEDTITELQSREGLSGLAEKAAREK